MDETNGQKPREEEIRQVLKEALKLLEDNCETTEFHPRAWKLMEKRLMVG